MHPVEIAEEIRKIDFFQNFEDSMVLQIATMIRPTTFWAGDFILTAGQKNDNLYFLRKGEVEILVDNERVFELNRFGEVLGEISALSDMPVSASVWAKSEVECFVLHAPDFHHVHPQQKDRFLFLLYKIYSMVVTERLVKMNEKAKKFEATARELEKAKKELEAFSSAKMNFLIQEAQKTNVGRKILLFDSNKKNHLISKNVLGGTGLQMELTSNEDEAISYLDTNDYDLILVELVNSPFFAKLREKKLTQKTVITAPLLVDLKILKDLTDFPNLISRDSGDRGSSAKTLLTTITKILNHDYFGLEKYLSWGVDLQTLHVFRSQDREPARERMLDYFREIGIRGSLLDRAQVSCEELLMNAIYDAPTDFKTGKSLYNHLPRTQPLELPEDQAAILRYGSDGVMMGLSVRDPFGALTRSVIISYLESCYSGNAGIYNKEKGGAGRGLHQIIESTDLTVFNVQKNYATEVICLWNLENAISKKFTQPSFHFFISE